MWDDYGLNVGSTLASTVAGDVILSGHSGGTNASVPVHAIGVNLDQRGDGLGR